MARGWSPFRFSRGRRGRGLRGGEHHPLETLDVEHLGLERDSAGVLDALGAVAAYEPKQRIDAAHARPRQRHIKQRRCEAANGLAVRGGLALEERNVAQGVRALVRREVARVDRAAARGLARMRLHERAVS